MRDEEAKFGLWVLAGGVCGAIAALLVGIGELALHFTPSAVYGGDYRFLLDVPRSRLTWGHFLSVHALPLYFIGYWHLFHMLKPAAFWIRATIFTLGVYAFAIGNVWIGSRVYLALLIQAKEGSQQAAQGTLQSLLDDASFYNETLLAVVRISIVIVSIAFFVLVVRGRSSYPRWMAAFNPIFLVLLCFLLYFIAPKIGGYLMPTAMNVAHFILFSLSSFICYRSWLKNKVA